MKTVRFSKIVENSGAPESHLLLTAPEKDKRLQSALRQHRVMTIHQTVTGHGADHGSVGLEDEDGDSRQILVFPKSIREFSGAKVIGINYDLLESAGEPEAEIPKPARKPKPKPKAKSLPKPGPKSKSAPAPEPEPPPVEPPAATADLEPILKAVKAAMDLLEEGRQVAAFKTLKTIVDQY